MKLKIKVIDNITKKVIYKEINLPNKDHLNAQLKYKAKTFKPKKGKGSFSRKKLKKIENF